MNTDAYPFELFWADDAVVLRVDSDEYTLSPDEATAFAADLQEMATRTQHGLDHDEE